MCVHNTPVVYLKTSTEGILNQTYEDSEFVIVDDAFYDVQVLKYLNEVSKAQVDYLNVHTYICLVGRKLKTYKKYF